MKKSRLTTFTALVATFRYEEIKEINIIWGDESVGKAFSLQV